MPSFPSPENRTDAKHNQVVCRCRSHRGAAGSALVAHGALADNSSTQYSVLTKSTPSGLTVVAENDAARVAATSSKPIFLDDPSFTHVDSASAREAAAPDGRLRIWIARSTNDGVCVLADAPGLGSEGPGSSCSADGVIDRGAFIEQNFGPTNKAIVGAAPDSTDSATVTLSDGTIKTVPVKDNAYGFVTKASAVSVVLNSGSQTTTILNGVER